MKLQKGTSLALYSVLEFAANPGQQLSAAEIAEKYGASTHHLAKVLRELGRAGLVESARGVGGGYRFSGNARRLTLMDVIELFEDISTRTGRASAAPSPRRRQRSRSSLRTGDRGWGRLPSRTGSFVLSGSFNLDQDSQHPV